MNNFNNDFSNLISMLSTRRGMHQPGLFSLTTLTVKRTSGRKPSAGDGRWNL